MDLFENYCLKAAEQGHYPAICAIAHYYQSLNRLNEVIPSLDDDVYIWSQKAAKKGDSQSIRYLAEWSELCDIEKIEKDNDESLPSALDWYLKAAERDDIPSILKAAHILYHGMNVKPNLEKAIELFIKASRLASLPSTLLQIGHIYSLGHHEELGQDFVKAFELYEEAARGGDAEAIKCLADALYHGIGKFFNLKSNRM